MKKYENTMVTNDFKIMFILCTGYNLCDGSLTFFCIVFVDVIRSLSHRYYLMFFSAPATTYVMAVFHAFWIVCNYELDTSLSCNNIADLLHLKPPC